MLLYAVSDVHGFTAELKEALDKSGFFTDTEPHKLIILGDALDRGKEAVEMQKFMMELMEKDELIFIKGNHEWLLEDMINCFDYYKTDIGWGYSHHVGNGTWDTAKQLAGMTEFEAFANIEKFLYKVKSSDFYSKLIPASVNYFETQNYIFVHSWIPVIHKDKYPSYYVKKRKFEWNPDWRYASQSEWNDAMWGNPFDMAAKGLNQTGKTIVFGHWNCSAGWAKAEGCSEFGKTAKFEPFYGDGFISIDACTAHSKKVNVLVINDNL